MNAQAHTYELRSVASLRPYKYNPRTHSAEQIEQIRASIRQFGFTNPVLVSEDGALIAGHGRYLAAKAEGITELPSIVIRGLSEEQRRALVIADNKLALNAGWNEQLLTFELSQLLEAQFDLSVIGFSEEELAALLPQTGSEGNTDPDEAPPEPECPVSVAGDLWLLGPHRLLCGSSVLVQDVGLLLGGAAPHLMVTDPPYGVSYDATWRGKAGHATMGKNRIGKVTSDDKSDWREAWALFPGNIVYVWHGGLHSAAVAQSLLACGYALRAQIIWNKSVMAMSRGDYHWKHEPCWYAVKGTGKWTGDRKQTTVWDLQSPIHIMSGSKEEKTQHPTQKPAECMKRPIENNSVAGDAVYDPFVGSGTTIIAAQMTGRHAYAMELNPVYVDVCVERWQNFTGSQATLEADGRAFVDVKAERHGAA